MLHQPRTICLHANSNNEYLTSHLISPQTLGHQIKPFVSLDVVRAGEPTADDALLSSDSGTAIITFLISGEANYSDSTHKHGCLKQGDVLWMLSGSGIQYSLKPTTPDCISVKLRVALSPALKSAPAQSIFLDSALVEHDGPAQILLGQHGDASSQLALPALINYVVVTLAAGQAWIYEPPVNHRTAWVAVISGKIKTSDVLVTSDEIAVYESSNKSISFLAEEDGVFLLGTSQHYTHQECTHQEFTQNSAVEKHPTASLSESFNPKWTEAFVLCT